MQSIRLEAKIIKDWELEIVSRKVLNFLLFLEIKLIWIIHIYLSIFLLIFSAPWPLYMTISFSILSSLQFCYFLILLVLLLKSFSCLFICIAPHFTNYCCQFCHSNVRVLSLNFLKNLSSVEKERWHWFFRRGRSLSMISFRHWW